MELTNKEVDLKFIEDLFKNVLGIDVKFVDVTTQQEKPVKEESQPYVNKTPEYYVRLLTIASNFPSPNVTIGMLEGIERLSKGALINLLLSIIAKDLDQQYPGHISDLDKVYCYSMNRGVIFELPQTEIKNKKSFEYFAAFRTKEDASFAIKTAYLIKNMLNKNEQKD